MNGNTMSRPFRETSNEPSMILQHARRISRAGCMVCKRRKVKCGEEKPSCLNCIKHSAACQYKKTPPSSRRCSTPFNCPEVNRDYSLTNFSIATAVSLNKANCNQIPNFNLFDLEMLHTYSNLTHLSVSHKPAKRAMWKIKIPKIGFSYMFVMRGLLSLSALQLRHLCNEKDKKDIYAHYAERQYHTALQEAAGQLCKITSDNCSALLLFEIINHSRFKKFSVGRPR